jgi:hypothetical protein
MVRISGDHCFELNEETKDIFTRLVNGPEDEDYRVDKHGLDPSLRIKWLVYQSKSSVTCDSRLKVIEFSWCDAFASKDPKRALRRPLTRRGKRDVSDNGPRDAVFRRYRQLRLPFDGFCQEGRVLGMSRDRVRISNPSMAGVYRSVWLAQQRNIRLNPRFQGT